MPFWKIYYSSFSSSSSSSDSKPSFASPSSKSKRGSRPQPRLTRQPKLRHLTDRDIQGLNFEKHPPGSLVSPISPPPWSPSSTNREFRSARSSSVRPFPLPLPAFAALLRRDEPPLPPSSWGCPLPSPKEVQSAGDVNYINGVDFPVADGAGASGRPSVGSTLDHGKKALQGSFEHIERDFKLIVPARNISTSGFVSPPLSPQRLSTGDVFPSPYKSYQGLQVRSASGFSVSDTTFFAQTSPKKPVAGPDHSQFYSPMGNIPPGMERRNHSVPTSPLHSKPYPEKSSASCDINVTLAVHPLPLPPGAALPTQSASFHQTALKSEVSSMKSQWQKGKLIGSGTFGSVYVGTNRETGALCAMKEVNLIPDDPKAAECMQQLEQEIKFLSQLKHQNIVQYYGSEIVEDRFYIHLEYVYPGSINKYIRDHGKMTDSMVRNFTRHVLSGLAYLHSTNTVHRDIKGANLLVDSSGVVKLADFGMAKHLSGEAAALSLKGSPHWMAPEVMQAMMQKDSGYDFAVDIWSLGCTIIEMFTGKPPWREFEGAAAMFKVLKSECPPIPETLSAEGKNFLKCCFRRNPGERPSAAKLLEHPFVNNSHHQEMHGCMQAVSQMKLMDIPQSPREKNSSIQISLQDSKGKQLPNGESSQFYPETSKSAAASRHSPRSTLDALPSLVS